MKIYRHIMGLLLAVPFISSCDNHVYDDMTWHSWTPGMVYCSNGEIMSYENCILQGNKPEAVLFFVDKDNSISGKAYAVSLDDYPSKEFIDPDTTYFAQGTSANIMQFDGEGNTIKLRYFQVQSPIAKSVNPKYFIPSVAEMYKMYTAKAIINNTIQKCGGTPLPFDQEECWYWTSTECKGAETDRAWRYSLTSGRFEVADKHCRFSTRPIISIRLNKDE